MAIMGNRQDLILQVTTSPLSDGVHVLTGTALGILGNVLPSTSAQLSLTIDTVLPQVSITTPLESEPLTSATRLSGTVDGTGTAIASLSYRFDNKSEILVPVSTNGTFDADLDFTGLEDGAHTLTVTTVDVAGNVATTNFNVQINLGENETAPVDLGSAYKFIGTTTPGNLKAREIDKYTFKVRGSELLSTATDKVLIGVTVRSASDSTLEPALPSIEGLTPLVTQSDTKSAFALFAIEREGQNLISVSGANNSTAGAYSLELSVGGDVNADGLVNNADTELLTLALGSTGTDAAYSPNLDLNRDRLINADDVELLNRNFGFIANLPPVFTPGDILTHQDLEATISLGDLVKDPDNDTVSYRASNPVNGTVQLSADGLSAVFQPADGFAGTASFDLEFEDGGGTFFPATVEVNVSDAPLLSLDFVKRNPRLMSGESTELVVIGDFADQQDVVLPDSYVTYSSENAEVAQISDTGLVSGVADGNTVLSAQSQNIQAVTAVRVGELASPENDAELNVAIAEINGLDPYPDAVSLPEEGKRQLSLTLNGDPASPSLSAGESGTRYFVSNQNVANVSQDGLITAIDEGVATVTAIHGAAEAVIPIRVENPQVGPATLGADGGVVQASDGSLVMVAPGALADDTSVSLTPQSRNDLSLPVPDGLEFAGAFKLDVGDDPLKGSAT